MSAFVMPAACVTTSVSGPPAQSETICTAGWLAVSRSACPVPSAALRNSPKPVVFHRGEHDAPAVRRPEGIDVPAVESQAVRDLAGEIVDDDIGITAVADDVQRDAIAGGARCAACCTPAAE